MLVHDKNGAARDALFAQVHAVLFARGALGMKIRQQRILDAHFFRVGLV